MSTTEDGTPGCAADPDVRNCSYNRATTSEKRRMATTPPHAVRVMRTQHLMRRDRSLRKYLEICNSSCLIKSIRLQCQAGHAGLDAPRPICRAVHSTLLSEVGSLSIPACCDSDTQSSVARGEMLSGSSIVSVSSAAQDWGAQLAYCGVDMHGSPAGPWPEGPGRVH